MKLKLLTVILVLAALFSGVVLWRVDRFVYGDRMAWAESQARSQMSSLTQAINAEINSGRRMLSTVTSDSFRPDGTNWKALQPYYTLALMTSQNGSMSISRLVNRPDSPAAGWTAVQLAQYMGFLGKELESKSTVLLRSFKDPQKKHHVALIFAGGGTAYILIGSGENFQGLIDSQKGSMSSFAIVAGDGLTISHPVSDYIGNVMSDSTLLKEIRKTGSAQGVGTYQQGQKAVFGMYERVAGTNSYVISTVPLEDLLRGRMSLAWQFFFLAAGFATLGAALYFWYEKNNPGSSLLSEPVLAPTVAAPPLTVPPSTTVTAATLPAATKTAPVKPALPGAHAASVVLDAAALAAPLAPKTSVPVTITPEEPSQDKAEAYRQVASALGQEMRAPIASILGFSQMVLSKTQEPEVVQAVESILREARSSRDVLEKLYTYSGQRTSNKTEIKIEGPLTQALKRMDNLLRDKGVVVEKDFKETTPWPLAQDDLVKVFENIFANAIEAMERMQDKRLRLSVWEDANGLHVTIADTGEGIAAENLQKIFDPFFTTRSFAHHVGLGLPVVVGILKEHHAEVQIHSVRGEGTRVEITVRPEAKQAHLAAPVAAASTDTAVRRAADNEIPSTVLKAPTPSLPSAPTPSLPSAPPPPPSSAPQNAKQDAPPPVTATAPSTPPRKLTDVNVDRLLDISSDEMPLEFLDGQGFSSSETVVTPLSPKVSRETSEPVAPPPTKPPPLMVSVKEPPLMVSVKEPPMDEIVEPEIVEAAMDESATEAPTSPPPFVIDESNSSDEILTSEEKTVFVASTALDDNNDEDFDGFVAGPKPSLPKRAPAILPDEPTPPEPEKPMELEAAPVSKVVIDKPKPRPTPVAASALDSYKVEIRRPGKRT